MSNKYYFSEFDDEKCYDLNYFKELLKDENLQEIKLYEAKRMTGEDFFYCTEYFEVGEKSDGNCGILCEGYKPRNGKNGRCKFSAHCYEPTYKIKILKKDIK